jgi:hypothetical protein
LERLTFYTVSVSLVKKQVKRTTGENHSPAGWFYLGYLQFAEAQQTKLVKIGWLGVAVSSTG